MAATTTSSSGHVVSKLQQTAEKLRLETTQLRERLRGERDAVRALRAQHAAELRSERAAARRRHVELEAQLNASKPVASSTSTIVSACEQCAKLRACHDAELRRDRCEHKKREAQLRAQLNEARRESAASSSGGAEGVTCQQCVRLSKDLTKQKELAKDIEERLQNVVEADRLKAADLRVQHEKHIMEMSKITRASKQDVHKMLEELKTKNRIIEQLRRSAGKIRNNKGDEVRGDGGEGGAENTQMRKLREDGRRAEQPALLPLEACDPKADLASLHNKFQDEVVERSAANKHREQMTCGGPGDDLEPTTEEDTDSAVSSAPSSLSPQPCSPLNDECGPLRCMMATRASITLHDTPLPTSLSPQPSEGYTTPPLDMWTDEGDNDGGNYNNDDGRTENELTMAKRQVRELERALLMTRAAKSGRHVMALSERIRQLEDRESELLRELGDLREQNELLEFRVLELAECPDRPAIISDQWNEKHDACTGTDDEHLVNQLNEEPVRRRLLEMSRRTYDMEDKRCLLQVLMLLHGLDELSSQHKEGFTIDTNEHQLEQIQVPSQIITGGSRNTVRDRQPDRLVAKVPPFTGRSAESDDDRATPVRAQEPSVPVLNTRGTQTDKSTSNNLASDEDSEDARSLNLTAEVRKLDKLRETIEVVGNRNGRLVVSGGVVVNSGVCSEQKHAHQLEFYRERVDVLERKVRVYESSGETQVRQLAERLNREVRLQAQVKQLTTAVQKLQTENSRLDEERCELEEAENDTRLHCQRLEAEVVQLERSKMSSKRRAREARCQATYWESMVGKYEERIYELEELECDLRHRLEVIEHTAPAIMLFNMWQKIQHNPDQDVTAEALDRLKRGVKRDPSPAARSKSRSPQRRGCACSSTNDKVKTLEEERDRLIREKKDTDMKVHNLEKQLTNVKNPNAVQNSNSVLSVNSSDIEMMKIVQDLKERERDMKKRIEELEHREAAYMETLQQADDIWADMEMKFKKRITQAEQSEATMRDRLRRLEKRDPVDVGELEESERALAQRAERLERDNNRLVTENKRLERELREIREDALRRTDEVTGRLGVDLDREKRRSQQLEQRLIETNASLQDAGNAHQLEVDALKERLSRTTNELVHLEVTNGELREEVDTLECKITEMEKAMKERVTTDEQMIRGLSQELNERDRELAEIQKREMDSAAAAGERLGAALQSVKQCDICSENASPDLVQTVEGVRTMCELVSCPTTRPPDDAQVSDYGDGLECTSATCPEKLKLTKAPSGVVSAKPSTRSLPVSAVTPRISHPGIGAASDEKTEVILSAKPSEGIPGILLSAPTSGILSSKPSAAPSGILSSKLSAAPSGILSSKTSAAPSGILSSKPSAAPSGILSSKPSAAPSGILSSKPSAAPSGILSSKPSAAPSGILSSKPSAAPSGILSSEPSAAPSGILSSKPSAAMKQVSIPAVVIQSSTKLSGILSVKSATPSTAPISGKSSGLKPGSVPASAVGSEKSITVLSAIKSGMASATPSEKMSSRAISGAPSATSAKSVKLNVPDSEVVALRSDDIPPTEIITTIMADDNDILITDTIHVDAPSAKISAVNTFAVAKSPSSTAASLRSGTPSAVRTKSRQSTRITMDGADNLMLKNVSHLASTHSGVTTKSGISVAKTALSAQSSRISEISSMAGQSKTSSRGDVASIASSKAISALSSKRASDEICDLVTEVDVLGEPPFEELIAVVDLESGPTPEGINIIANVTDSGNLELETEGPPGVVEHTMLFSASGNMEVVTDYTPLPNATSGAIDQVPSYFHEDKEPTGPDIKAISNIPAEKPLSSAPSPMNLPSVPTKSSTASKIQPSIEQLINKITPVESAHVQSIPALLTTDIASKEPSVNNLKQQIKQVESQSSIRKHVTFPPSKSYSEPIHTIPAEKDEATSREAVLTKTKPLEPDTTSPSTHSQNFLTVEKDSSRISSQISDLHKLPSEKEIKEQNYKESRQKVNMGVQCTCPVEQIKMPITMADRDEMQKILPTKSGPCICLPQPDSGKTQPQSSYKPTAPSQPFNYIDHMKILPRDLSPFPNVEQMLCVCPMFEQQTNQQIPQCAPSPQAMYGGANQPYMNQFYPPGPFPPPQPQPSYGGGYLLCPAYQPFPPMGYPPMNGPFSSPGYPPMNGQFTSSGYPPMNGQQMPGMSASPYGYPSTNAPMPFNLPYQHPANMYGCAPVCPGPPPPNMATRQPGPSMATNLCETYKCPVVVVQRESIIQVDYTDAEKQPEADPKLTAVNKEDESTGKLQINKEPSSEEELVTKPTIQALYPSSQLADDATPSTNKEEASGEKARESAETIESEPGSLLSVSIEFVMDDDSDASMKTAKSTTSSKPAIITSPPSPPSVKTPMASVHSLKKLSSHIPLPVPKEASRRPSVSSQASTRSGIPSTQSRISAKKSGVSFKSASSSSAVISKPLRETLTTVQAAVKFKSATSAKDIIPVIKSSNISQASSLKDRPSTASGVISKSSRTPSRQLSPMAPIGKTESTCSARSIPAMPSKSASRHTAASRQPSHLLTVPEPVGKRASTISPRRSQTVPSKSTSRQPSLLLTTTEPVDKKASTISPRRSQTVPSKSTSRIPSRILSAKESVAAKPSALTKPTSSSRQASALPTQHGNDCSCETCKCRPCKDPKITSVPREPKPDVDKKSSKQCPTCHCEICRCPDCIDKSKKRKQGDDLPSSIGQEEVFEGNIQELGSPSFQLENPIDVISEAGPETSIKPASSIKIATPAADTAATPPVVVEALPVTPNIPPVPEDEVKRCDCEACECEACPDRIKFPHVLSSQPSTKPSVPNAGGNIDTSGPADIIAGADTTGPYTTAAAAATESLNKRDLDGTKNIPPENEQSCAAEPSEISGVWFGPEVSGIAFPADSTVAEMSRDTSSVFAPVMESTQYPYNLYPTTVEGESSIGFGESTIYGPGDWSVHDLPSDRTPDTPVAQSSGFWSDVMYGRVVNAPPEQVYDMSSDKTEEPLIESSGIWSDVMYGRPAHAPPDTVHDMSSDETEDFEPIIASSGIWSDIVHGMGEGTTPARVRDMSSDRTEDLVPKFESTPIPEAHNTSDYVSSGPPYSKLTETGSDDVFYTATSGIEVSKTTSQYSTPKPSPDLDRNTDQSDVSNMDNAPSLYSTPKPLPGLDGNIDQSDVSNMDNAPSLYSTPKPLPDLDKNIDQSDVSNIDNVPSQYDGPGEIGHPTDCKCSICKCDPCKRKKPAAHGIVQVQPTPTETAVGVEKKALLPPSLIGPDFIKPSMRNIPSQYPPEIQIGEKASLRPVAVTDAENWRTLDTETLNQRFNEMEKDAKLRANEIAQIRKFMDGLKCACKQQLQSVQMEHPLVAPEPSPTFAATMSGLQCALAFLQAKSEKKDHLIAAMTDELRLRAESGVFERVLQNVAADQNDQVPSFNRVAVSNALPKPDDMQRQVMRMPAEKPCGNTKTTAIVPSTAPSPPNTGVIETCYCDPAPDTVDPTPLAITEMRRIAPDSILVKWERPASKHVKGYEVEINGVTKSRVYSSGRTVAVLHGLQLDGTVQVSVYAVSVTGIRCQPPATAMYQHQPAALTAEEKNAH